MYSILAHNYFFNEIFVIVGFYGNMDPSSSSSKNKSSASSYLETKGFGWLLEVDDADDEEQLPLLLVFLTKSLE